MQTIDTKNIISRRLKQFRLAKGWSLDELVAKVGGIVSKVAISKYERGLMQPSPKVLTKISSALGVKSASLFSEPNIKIDFIAYRKCAALRVGQQTNIENYVSIALEKRVKLQKLLRQDQDLKIPIREMIIKQEEDAESAAFKLRQKWNLGNAPIANVVDVLEENGVHVLEIECDSKFDGISAVAYDEETKEVDAAAVVVRRGLVGERQRLNLSHELGHIVLKVPNEMDQEKIAFRFAGAFLAPRDLLTKEVGLKRSVIRTEELMLLKKRFGMSMQALMFRMKELEIINKYFYSEWFKTISRLGWRKNEPAQLSTEQPEWLKLNVLKAYAEGILSHQEAEAMLNEKIENGRPLKLIQMKSFLKLPISERQRILKEQAESMVSHYKDADKNMDLEIGDFYDYK